MRHSFMKYTAVATLAAGIIFAQPPGGNPQPGAAKPQPGMREGMCGQWEERAAQSLNLTDAQKEKARTIFQSARQSAEPIRQELKQNREQLMAAAKASPNEANIQKLATEQGRLMGQLITIRTMASAKFYQMLTLDQRAKAERPHEGVRQNAPPREHTTGP